MVAVRRTDLLFTAWAMVGAVWGPQDAENPLRKTLYVLVREGLVPASLAAEPVRRTICPARTLYRPIDLGGQLLLPGELWHVATRRIGAIGPQRSASCGWSWRVQITGR